MPEPNGAQIKEPGSKEPGDKTTSAEVKALTDMVKGLVTQVGTLTGRNTALEARQNQVFSPGFIQSLRGPAPEATPEPVVDLNELDNVGLAEHLITNVASLLDNKLGGLQKDINVVRAGQSLGDVRGRHGDFDHYLPKMREEWKKNPNIAPEECYRLAKYGNDEAVQAFEKSEKEKADEALKASLQTQPPGAQSSFNMEDHKDLSEDEQIAAAYEEIVMKKE